METGRIKVWSCDIIVDWADPQEEPDQDTMSQVRKNPDSNCIRIDSSSINPIIDVALEKGINNLFTKKFMYEKTTDDSETRFQVQLVTESIFWKLG